MAGDLLSPKSTSKLHQLPTVGEGGSNVIGARNEGAATTGFAPAVNIGNIRINNRNKSRGGNLGEPTPVGDGMYNYGGVQLATNTVNTITTSVTNTDPGLISAFNSALQSAFGQSNRVIESAASTGDGLALVQPETSFLKDNAIVLIVAGAAVLLAFLFLRK